MICGESKGAERKNFHGSAKTVVIPLADNLIIRILKYHARSLTDIPDLGFVPRIHPVHPYGSFRGIQNGIDMLGESGFPGTVVAVGKRRRFQGQNHNGRRKFHGNCQDREINIRIYQTG